MAAIRAALEVDKRDGWFARIKRLATTNDVGVFTPADTVDILRVCTGLTSLEIALGEYDDDEDDDEDSHRDGLDSLTGNHPKLNVISLRNFELWDLEFLLDCQHVTVHSTMHLDREWLMKWYITLPFDERPKPSQRMESLTVELGPGGCNCFVIAQFLLCVINKCTVVKVIAGTDDSMVKRLAREVSETLRLLRRIRAYEELSEPGYRHVGFSDDSPCRQDTFKTL